LPSKPEKIRTTEVMRARVAGCSSHRIRHKRVPHRANYMSFVPSWNHISEGVCPSSEKNMRRATEGQGPGYLRKMHSVDLGSRDKTPPPSFPSSFKPGAMMR
jgi:hypothetical protein